MYTERERKLCSCDSIRQQFKRMWGQCYGSKLRSSQEHGPI